MMSMKNLGYIYGGEKRDGGGNFGQGWLEKWVEFGDFKAKSERVLHVKSHISTRSLSVFKLF